jgi:hypothetical protein
VNHRYPWPPAVERSWRLNSCHFEFPGTTLSFMIVAVIMSRFEMRLVARKRRSSAIRPALEVRASSVQLRRLVGGRGGRDCSRT